MVAIWLPPSLPFPVALVLILCALAWVQYRTERDRPVSRQRPVKRRPS